MNPNIPDMFLDESEELSELEVMILASGITQLHMSLTDDLTGVEVSVRTPKVYASHTSSTFSEALKGALTLVQQKEAKS